MGPQGQGVCLHVAILCYVILFGRAKGLRVWGRGSIQGVLMGLCWASKSFWLGWLFDQGWSLHS
jgi:hypothetical protein